MPPNQPLGHISAIFRYPVKSMAGEELESARVVFTGLEGDRRYGFVRSAGARSVQVDFPWFTGRDYPRLVTYRAAYEDGTDRVGVTSPDGTRHAVDSEALHGRLERESGKAITLLRLGRGTYDGAPVSLLSTSTVASVSAAADLEAHDVRRFRPNLLIELAAGTHEDEWIGRALRVGESVTLWATEPDNRCMMINLDPETGQQQPQVLRHVANARRNKLGIYAVVVREGVVRVGDTLRLD